MSLKLSYWISSLHRMAAPIVNRYLNSWWLPSGFFFSILTLWILTVPVRQILFGYLFLFLLLALPLSVVGIACAAIMNCVRDLRLQCLINTGMCVLCFVIGNVAFVLIAGAVLFDSRPDGFAKSLTIPEGIEFAIPYENIEYFTGPAKNRPPQSPSPESITRGEPRFDLTNVSQPGNYCASIWINPGEAGMIYLKAYEVTNETRLSSSKLKEKTMSRVEWSDDADELFFSSTTFKIYEGDWGDYYAARFEIWFKPDGWWTKERKLMEKVFRVEGWQR